MPVKVSLNFRECDEENPCNIFYPKGGMKALVYSKQTRSMILLHKIVPDGNSGEIHKLMIESVVKENGKGKGGNVQIYPSPPTENTMVKVQDQTKLPLESINENEDHIGEELDNTDRINVSDSNINPDGDFGTDTGNDVK